MIPMLRSEPKAAKGRQNVRNTRRQKQCFNDEVKILFLSVFMIVSDTGISSQEQQHGTTQVLSDGTTIIHAYDETGRLLQEDLILKSGRHKTTFFDSHGKPKYGVVTTGTGSFGLMYYDEMKSPLFKFWDHGNNDTVIQFYSINLEPIGKIKMLLSGGERKVFWEDEHGRNALRSAIIILSAVIALAVAFISGILMGRKSLA
jgi:hypothetical protein